MSTTPASLVAWKNRIIGEGDESPEQLLANPRNFRIHPKAQQDALSGVLNEVGWVQRVLVNQRTGHVIDGHLRVSLAITRQESTVPVLYVDLDESEERLILATLDPLSALAATDTDQLAALLAEVSPTDDALVAMLADLAVREGLAAPNVEFKEYGEDTADDVKYSECPECGHKWPA